MPGVEALSDAELMRQLGGDAPPETPAALSNEALLDALRATPPAEKAVDIPDVNSLVLGNMARERDALPWYSRIPQRTLEPVAEMEVQGGRALTGSPIPALPPNRLVTDVAQTAGLVAPFFPVGRLVSAAIQGGAGLATGMQDAADAHMASGGSWEDQIAKMDDADAISIGIQTMIGLGTGALFPGTEAAPQSEIGGLARAERDLGTMAPRPTAALDLPPPRSGEVRAAFARIQRDPEVDATAWRSIIDQHRLDRKSVPAEVMAIYDRLRPEMRPDVLTRHESLGAGWVVPVPEVIQRPTGRYFATAGDLLDANMVLGNMLSPQHRAAADALGHSAGNLSALKTELSDALAQALPAGQRDLYAIARDTTREVGRDTAGLRLVEKYLNPTEGRLNGPGLYNALTGATREKMIRRLGMERYQQLVDFSRSVRAIMGDPAKANTFQAILGLGEKVGVGMAGTEYALSGAVGTAAPAAAVGAMGLRSLYGLATSRTALRQLDRMANLSSTSRGFLSAAGRIALGHQLSVREERRDTEHAASLAPAGPSPLPLPTATPRPLGRVGAP